VSSKPKFKAVPRHIALVMDGNGRWANSRGLTRTEGHRAGEAALFDVVIGAIEAGVEYLTVYAFSTENWNRSPDEVRFLMGFNREVLVRRRDQLNELNVRVRWAGNSRRLWRSVVRELTDAERATASNTGLTLTMAINYGGRQELVTAIQRVAQRVASGDLKPDRITEKTIQRELYTADLPDVDLFLRSSGEQRTSNFLPWQSTYAEMVFMPELWPDFNRETLWRAIEEYGSRQRRFGAASDAPLN
jgi:undecaprenyl diphosphate synthase